MSDIPKTGTNAPNSGTTTHAFFKAEDFGAHVYGSSVAVQIADTANRLLTERGKYLYRTAGAFAATAWKDEPDSTSNQRILCVGAVQPIARESAEDVLRDMVAVRNKIDRVTYVDDCGLHNGQFVFDLIERARRVLERKP